MRVYDEHRMHRRIHSILQSDAKPVFAIGDVTHLHSRIQTKSNISHIHVPADITGLQNSTWPIGSIFIAVVSTNPATLLGFGTWTAFAPGRVMVGIDSGQSEFDTVEETGGAKTHTLTSAEMPAHTHLQDAHTHIQDAHNHSTFGVGTGLGLLGGGAAGVGVVGATVATNQNTTPTNQNTGGGTAHNNLQPYVVIYAWKRTA